MAGLPLYLMAIPLRRSLAAGMDLRGERLQKLDRYNVEALKLYSGRAPSLHALQQFAIVGQALRLPHWETDAVALQQFQPRQILRIDDAHWHVVVINHDQIVDAMTLQQVQNFHR